MKSYSSDIKEVGGDIPSMGGVYKDRMAEGTGSWYIHRNNWGNEDRLKKSKVQMTLTDGWGKQPKDLQTE